MKYVKIQVSDRKFLIGQLEEGGECNLGIFSQQELGSKGQMLPVTNVKILTNKLDFSKAMKLYCYLETSTPLTEELKELLKT